MKPFSTSVFKALIWMFAATTKICTRSCFTQAYAESFIANFHALLLIAASCTNNDWVSVTRLSAIHFRVWSIRQVSCHTHSSAISTSMTTVLLLIWTNTLYGIWWASTWAPQPNVRFIPHRQFCLPKMAHVELTLVPEIHQSNHRILPIWSLRIGREQQVPDSSNHSLHLIKLFNSINPEGNFGRNQPLDGSICLSSLYPSITKKLHVSIATSRHQSSPDCALLKHRSPSFGS